MSKIIGNTTTTPVPRSDWSQTDKTKADFIRHKPELGAISEKDIIDKADLNTDIQSSLEEIDTKANVVTLTTEEYTALEQAEATNANTLYMLTDAEEEIRTQVQIITPTDDENLTEKLQILQIYKLTEEQYRQKLESENIEDNALYLTPDEEIDLAPYATIEYVDEAFSNIAFKEHNHNDIYYTEIEIDEKLADKSDITHNHDTVYETQANAVLKLDQAKSYADAVSSNAANAIKNDLLNGAGGAYDTLKELGDLIDENTDAIGALEQVATNKADKAHNHNISEVTNLQDMLNNKSQVQIITWEDDD